ncbi:MAG: S46 family peptidase, partial [Bacteroidota bacterium]
FDRAFTATINDFAWDEQYSRSIGVDIRFVLWMLEEVAGASHLIKEMGVKR